MQKSLTIVIPCYNEAKSLPLFLPELLSFINEKDYRLIITNDGSKDETLKILEESFINQPRCTIVSHKLNRGYGGAIKSGVKEAETDFVITIDADGQHYLKDVENLYNQIIGEDADMIIGSRKGQKEASAVRGLGKSLIRQVARLLMPLEIYDINSGMKIYNTTLAKKYLPLIPDTMAYSDIIALVFINQRHKVLEIPIQIKPRLAGESTINVRTVYDTIIEIINIVVLFNPMRIFLPVAIVFFLSGLLWEIPIFLRGVGVSVGAGMLMVTGCISFMLGLVTEQLSQIRKMLVDR